MKNPMRYNLGIRINERNITRALQGFQGGKLLDVGCGLGYLTEKLSVNFNTIGMDIDKESVRFARENVSASFVIGDASMLPFRDSSLDCVVASEVIEHLPEDEGFVGELGRATKVGATVVITTPSTEGLLKVSEACHGSGPERHYRPGYTKKELQIKLGRYFRIVSVRYSMTLFTRIAMELIKKAYSRKYGAFENQKDIFRATGSRLFRMYKSIFPSLWIFIYVDEILYRFLKGSNIMVVARRRV